MAVIVGLSDSELGRAAIDRAVEEASIRDLPLVLTSHVTTPLRDGAVRELSDSLEETGRELERRARELSDRGVRCIAYMPSRPSSAADAVLAAAEEHHAELIVVGVPRRSAVGKAVLGSTAQDVILGADCKVLGMKLPPERESGS